LTDGRRTDKVWNLAAQISIAADRFHEACGWGKQSFAAG